MSKRIYFIVLLLFSLPVNAGIEDGDFAVSVYGSLSAVSVGTEDSDSLTLFASGGYFITESIELQGALLLSTAETSGGSTYDVTGYGLNANYYFAEINQNLVTYVGIGALYLATDLDGEEDSSGAFTGQLGIKHFVDEKVSFNYQAQGVASLFFDATILSIGLSYYF